MTYLRILILITLSVEVFAQQREIQAVRITRPPKIDGVLNDSCWLSAPIHKDFLTNEPVFGNPPGETTEVQFLYDDEAIYAAYSLYDKNPDKIIKVLSERDKTVLADELMMGLDTYLDKISAFRFQVSAAGVQSDRFMSPFIPRTDKSWDAVWQSGVSKNENGWSVEMKIPFSALRFPRKKEQVWGIQFGRFVGRTGEFTTWSPVNPNIGGGPVRQWGVLSGISDIKLPVRLSVRPYLTIGLQHTPSLTDASVYNNKSYYSGGMDLKYGINQAFTLDMTLVPDFSQVQSDNTVLNLTPFEVKYEERRQFFTEGTDMFNKAGVFYSRRIGAVPSGFASVSAQIKPGETLAENPSITRLLNATKVSGRTNKGLGIGILNAITENAYASISDDATSDTRKLLTEPSANFNALVIDQSLKNNSKVGAINTNVARSGNGIDANVSALDFILNTKGNLYSLIGTGIYSHREGSSVKEDQQNGYNYKLSFAKVSKLLRYEINHSEVSEYYNPNDMGILTATNFSQNYLALGYSTFKPYKKILNWNATLSYAHTHTLSNGMFQKSEAELSANFLMKNFSSIAFVTTSNPRQALDIYEPRTTGLFFTRPKAWRTSIRYGTDSRKPSQLQITGAFKTFTLPENHYQLELGVLPTVRAGNHLLITASSQFYLHRNNQGFATKPDATTTVFGLRQEQNLENIAQIQYFFSAYSNVSFRARDYWSRIRYDSYYTLDQDGSLQSFSYNGNADANLNIFNIDMIYTWQFRPGSFLSLSWKTNINHNTKSRDDKYFASLSEALNAPQFTTLSLRILYYLDYSQVRGMVRQKKLK